MRTYRVDKTVLHLQIARTLRSISQGIAVVDLALYLKDLHWSAASIGAAFTGAGVVGAALILGVGVLSDRYGRKPFLVVYETLTALAALLMVFTTSPAVIAAIIVITGFGRGQNGAAGPFTPAEQAWLAAHVPRHLRGRVFSTNTALGFLGMAVGAVAGGMTHLWHGVWTGPHQYQPLFFLMFMISAACIVVIATIPGEKSNAVLAGRAETPAAERSDSRSTSSDRQIRTVENKNMAKLAVVNLLNGLGVGFMGPMMTYWFAVKFGASASEIGMTLAVSFVVTACASVMSGMLADRFGMVRSVVWLRVFGVVMILCLPLLPSFWLASLVYIIRSALSRGTQGARSALSSSLTRDQRRGFSVSMNSLAMRLSSAVGPTLSGYMLDVGALSAPFYVTGVLQLASSWLYAYWFRHFDEPAKKQVNNE